MDPAEDSTSSDQSQGDTGPGAHGRPSSDDDGPSKRPFTFGGPLSEQSMDPTRTFDGGGTDNAIAVGIGYLNLEPPLREGAVGRLAHYEVLESLGHGAMGVVLKAFDEQLHRQVAIKLMSPELIASAGARERFFREARAAAVINHPNVVTIHAVAEHRGLPFLVMEYVNGVTLQHRIRNGDPLTIENALRICLQICEGLSAAHRQGVVHRDIKPANVMLEHGIERVKIADFGLARVAMEKSDLTSLGDMIGTPSYMSPEQVEGKNLDARSDLFSLGCVMYAMVAGTSPFRSSNALATAHRVKSEQHTSLYGAVDNVPERFSQIVDRLLMKNPGDRFESADVLHEELSEELRELVRDPDSTAPIRRSTESAAGPRSRRPQTAALLAVVAAIVVAVYLLPDSTVQPVDFSGSGQQSSEKPADDVTPEVVADTPQGLVLVSQDGSKDAATLAEALQQVAPNGVIRIVDDGRYTEPLVIDSADEWSGITLEASGNAVLTAVPQPVSGRAATVLTVRDTPGVRIRGLTIETANIQHGVEITGECPGVEISNCSIVTTTPDRGTSPIGMVYVHDQAAGTAEAPIVFESCRVICGGVGFVIGAENNVEPVSHIVIRDCSVRAPARGSGIPIILMTHISDILITRNTLSTAEVGLSMTFDTSNRVQALEISHNTIHDAVHGLGLFTESQQDMKIESNLFVNCSNVDPEGPVAPERVRQFSGNWWEKSPDCDTYQITEIAKAVDAIPFISREPSEEGFLVPTAEAPAGVPGRFAATDGTR